MGWSTCGSSNKEYITGFYRNNSGGSKETIYLLEKAKCCKAIAPYQNSLSHCIFANRCGIPAQTACNKIVSFEFFNFSFKLHNCNLAYYFHPFLYCNRFDCPLFFCERKLERLIKCHNNNNCLYPTFSQYNPFILLLGDIPFHLLFHFSYIT